MKKVLIILTILVIIGCFIFLKRDKGELNLEMEEIKLRVNGNVFTVKLEDNTSSEALLQKLKTNDLIIEMHDYGNFEKVGSLGFTLPTLDKEITTKPGDLILYQGTNLTLYYDTNTWTFTKLGEIENITKEELLNVLGDEDVTITLSID